MSRRLRPRIAPLFALASLVVSAAPDAAANDDYDDWDGGFDGPPAERRSGFSAGLAGGLMLGGARGYPNDPAKIDEPEYEANTGLGVSSGGTLWIGGALTDWFSFGLGTTGGGFSGNGLDATGGAFVIHIETFPLFYQGGMWRDAGISLNVGTGGFTINEGSKEVAEGAGTAVVGLGAFYEPFRWWQLSMGPSVEYTHHFFQSMSVHSAVIGWRTVFYGGP